MAAAVLGVRSLIWQTDVTGISSLCAIPHPVITTPVYRRRWGDSDSSDWMEKECRSRMEMLMVRTKSAGFLGPIIATPRSQQNGALEDRDGGSLHLDLTLGLWFRKF